MEQLQVMLKAVVRQKKAQAHKKTLALLQVQSHHTSCQAPSLLLKCMHKYAWQQAGRLLTDIQRLLLRAAAAFYVPSPLSSSEVRMRLSLGVPFSVSRESRRSLTRRPHK